MSWQAQALGYGTWLFLAFIAGGATWAWLSERWEKRNHAAQQKVEAEQRAARGPVCPWCEQAVPAGESRHEVAA